jgi:hypothetical protein
MAKRKILTAGDYDFHQIIKDLNDKERGLVFEDFADDLTGFMKHLNEENYFGVLLQTLSLDGGKDTHIYLKNMEKFSEFDHPPYSWYSTGLFAVEQSLKKGLICVVDDFVNYTDSEVLQKAKELGAKIISTEPREIGDFYLPFLQ